MNSLISIGRSLIPFLSPFHISVDFGTTTTRIGIRNKGVVLREPTIIGYNQRTKEPIFFGTEARQIVGKTPEFIKLIHPVVRGIVSDFDASVLLLRQLIQLSVHPYLSYRRILKPSIHATTCFPVHATEIEQKAVEEALYKVGCSSVDLVEKPLATATGIDAGFSFQEPTLVVDLGGGAFEISIVSGQGIVSEKTLYMAGEAMNKTISNYVYLKHGIILGESSCERLKTELMHFGRSEKQTMVRGKSLENGLPKSIRIRSDELKEALLPGFKLVIESIRELIESSPPELVDEVYNRGIILTGGGSTIPGISDFFSAELNIPTKTHHNSVDATIIGLIEISKKAF